jgi:serine/threonine-protein kinase RsbW
VSDVVVRDIVEVRLPASSSYLSVLRTATAGLAARLDFTLDEIEDLRIAVDEACATLLSQARPEPGLTCLFTVEGDALSVRVSVESDHPKLPQRDTFGWTVLSALAGEVDAVAEGEHGVSIILVKRRGESAPNSGPIRQIDVPGMSLGTGSTGSTGSTA